MVQLSRVCLFLCNVGLNTYIYRQNKIIQFLNENRFVLLLISYSLLLLFVGLLNSRVFHKYVKMSYRKLTDYLTSSSSSSSSSSSTYDWYDALIYTLISFLPKISICLLYFRKLIIFFLLCLPISFIYDDFLFFFFF